MSSISGRESLTFTRHRNVIVSDDRSLRRAAARGDMTRLANGAYVPTAIWQALGRVERHRLAAAAAAEMNGTFRATHRTAAALLGAPTIGRGDGLVHTRVSLAAGSRTEHGYRKHAVADLDLHVIELDGIPTTNLERTVIDLAMSEPFESAVVTADWSLKHGATKETLRTTLDELAPARRRARAESVISFADGDSGSVGESISRVVIDRAGFPPPLLQQRFDDALGLIGFVDFYWPEFHLIGEFDGYEKYSNQLYLAGSLPSEIVFAEKVREDRLRATPDDPSVTRWIWDTVWSPTLLGRQLRAAGLPTVRRTAGGNGSAGRPRTPE